MKIISCPRCHNRMMEIKGRAICKKCRVEYLNNVTIQPTKAQKESQEIQVPENKQIEVNSNGTEQRESEPRVEDKQAQ